MNKKMITMLLLLAFVFGGCGTTIAESSVSSSTVESSEASVVESTSSTEDSSVVSVAPEDMIERTEVRKLIEMEGATAFTDIEGALALNSEEDFATVKKYYEDVMEQIKVVGGEIQLEELPADAGENWAFFGKYNGDKDFSISIVDFSGELEIIVTY